ncbi:MAG: hypothetical protein H0Z30_10320 [Candidatus Marinimicrobia bacterium]|nr:hypothetical protein [Candidatus Neomarinimicrobiota bacterium]
MIKTLPGGLSELYPKIPQDVIEEIARHLISSRLYYSSLYPEKNLLHKYSVHRKLGILVHGRLVCHIHGNSWLFQMG